MEMRKLYLNNGYIIVKDFFKKDDLNYIKKKFSNHSNNLTTKEIFDDVEIKKLFLNEAFFNLIKDILDSNKLVYFSDSSIVRHENIFSTTSGYHNDSRAEDYNYSKEYPLLRVATYLQESTNTSGGIKIKPQSHKYFCFTLRDVKQKIKTILKKFLNNDKNFKLKIFTSGIQPKLDLGDIIIWNLRTHHSGTAIKFKYFKNLSLHPLVEKLLPNFVKIPCLNRIAIFMVFGKELSEEKNLENYINDRHSRYKYVYENMDKLKSEFTNYNIKFIPSKKIDD